jgi:tetratricopeptide (TPR) repeat protein
VRSKVRQFVAREASHEAVSDAGKKALNRTFDDRAKRDMIPRLLMEYESGSLAQDKDYKSFLAELRTDLGISLFEGDDLDVAKNVLRKAVETESSEQSEIIRPKVYRYLGTIERKQKNYDQALVLLDQSIFEFNAVRKEQRPDLEAGLAKSIAQRGETYLLMERYPEAIADFSRAIELDSEDKGAISARGYTYRLIERYPEAIADFSRAIELDPEDDWALTQRGYIYQLVESYPEAIADFNRAIALNSENEGAIAQRGEVYLLLGKYEQALQDFEQVLQTETDNDWIFYTRSLAHTALNQTENARTDIHKAIQLAQKDYETKPQDCRNIFNLAIYHLISGEIKQATSLCQEALSKEPSLSRIKAAIRDLEDLLAVLPNHPHQTQAKALHYDLQAALTARSKGCASG